MTKEQAAQVVNAAFEKANINAVMADPKATELIVEIEGKVATHKIRYGVNAIHQRKDDVAQFRAELVKELAAGHVHLQDKPEGTVSGRTVDLDAPPTEEDDDDLPASIIPPVPAAFGIPAAPPPVAKE